MFSDTSPSTSSTADAPGSSYVSPTSNSIGFSPFNVITGAVVSSCSCSSSTVTVVITLSSGGVHTATKGANFDSITASISPATISTSSSPTANVAPFPDTVNGTNASSASCGVSGMGTPFSPTIFCVSLLTSRLKWLTWPLNGLINPLTASKLPVKSISISVTKSSTFSSVPEVTESGIDIVGVTFMLISNGDPNTSATHT